MNDDVQPPDTPGDQLEAVNAVLDGLATDPQRALVDGSPQLTQLLAEFQAHRRALAQVPVQVQVPAQTRELHIAAALAAFDEVHLAGAAAVTSAATASSAAPTSSSAPTASGAPTSTNVVSLARHRRMYRTLLGAAAAVVLVVGGVAALSSQRSSDDDSAATASESKVGGDDAATLDAPVPELAATGSASTDAAATESGEASTAMVADTAAPAMADDAAEAPAETSSAAETSAAPRSTIGSIDVGGADPLPVVADDVELASYAAAPPADADPQTVAACGPAGSDDLGNVSYQGTPSVVVRDPDSGQVLVYALDDCRLLTTLQT